MQDDVLFASLTVYQTLLYTAKLRLGNLTAEEQVQKVSLLLYYFSKKILRSNVFISRVWHSLTYTVLRSKT